MNNALTLDAVSINYGDQVVIDNCSFTLAQGRILSLLGASGCGKSTLLKAIAGLLPLANGSIALDDRTLSAPQKQLPPEQRGIGMIFQDYALFPHLTVAQNVAFGLYKAPKSEQREKTDQGLELVRLSSFANRYPHELSGGQQQRVAIARALVCKPKVLLFDEPFSNLDIQVREALMQDIKTLLNAQHITTIFVTHDKNEAFAMADDIAVMHNGKIAQFGASQAVYDHPNSRYVAEFLGNGVVLPMTEQGPSWQTPIGEIEKDQQQQVLRLKDDDEAFVYLRTHQISISTSNAGGAQIIDHDFRGDLNYYQLQLGQHSLHLVSQKRYAMGEFVTLSLNI